MRHPLALLLLAGFGGLGACDAKDDPVDSGLGLVGPALVHTAPASPLEGEPVDLSVGATDDDGVVSVTVFYRTSGDDRWTNAPMAPGDDDVWTVTVDGGDVSAPGLDYYFKAVDGGDVAATSYLPEASTEAPYTLPISVQGQPVPFVEDFELGEGQDDLSDIGWANASAGFRGYAWDVAGTQAHGGAGAAFHSRGYSGTDPMVDYLIGPALDLSTVETAQVSWWQYGTGTDAASHALYASLGSRDPADGDWVLVADLPAPAEGEWTWSGPVDLSAYAGHGAVYLAWVYTGVDADEWYVDDVRVEPLAPWLTASFSVDPSPISPAETGTLTVDLTNPSTVDAGEVTVAVAFPDGGASVQDGGSLAALAAGATDSVALPLAIDAATPDNSYVPVELTLTTGDQSWVVEDRILVGDASVATVVWEPWETGQLELTLGVGDPDAPAWEETIFAGEVSDTLEVAVDVTDRWAYLPPAPGDGRWFVRASPESDGGFGAFTLSYDGASYDAVTLDFVDEGDDGWAFVPSPPDLSVTASTRPSTLSPGDTGVALDLRVVNAGEATNGPLVATLVSSDPDVVVTDAGPLTLAADGLAGGAAAVATGVFAFDVSSAHVDSTDVDLELVLSDDLETWTLPVAFDVPFPVLVVTYTDIDDDDRDGLLEPGESADVELRLTNQGDLATSGTASATLSAESTSTASVTVSTASESYGTISAAQSRDPSDPWTVTVDGGAVGDTVDLLLTVVDSARTYEVRTQLVLGEAPWQALSSQADEPGDALDGWDFDFANGSYRVQDDVLEIELTSFTVFDPSRLFIEAWGYSPGADWLYHRLVLQSGVTTFQGYGDSGFVDLSEPTVTFPDATTVRFSIPIADAGFLVTSMELGFASGWCGPDEYWCDHYPDGWGYPYDSWDPSEWFSMTW